MTRWALTTTMLALSCAFLVFAWNASGDSTGRHGMQVTLVDANEAETVQGGAICLPIFYIPLKIGETGVGGCGGPTKDAQAFCNLTPLVCGPCFAPNRTHYFRSCMECGESCGSYDYIDPTSCSAGS